MNKFTNKIYQRYRLLKINKGASNLSKNFSGFYKAWKEVKTNPKEHDPLKEQEQEIAVGEFEVFKLKTGTGPSGEIIIDEPKKEVSEDIFFKFLNLSDENGKISSFNIYNFINRYGLLVNQPMEQKLLEEKYHLETLSFWRYEISLMNSLIKTYYNYQNENIEELKKIFIQSKKEFSDCFYRDNTYSSIETNNLKSNIEVFIDFHDMISPSGNFLVEEIYEQLFARVLFQVLNERLRQTTDTYITETEESGEFRSRDQRWIDIKSGYKDLLSFIWASFAHFIKTKTKINVCLNNRCKKFFTSQKFTRAKFHSDLCRSAYARDAKMWELAQKKFMNKAGMMIIDERETGLGKLTSFDAFLLNEKSKKVLAMLEFSYSEIDHKSLKWNHVKEKILKNLSQLYDTNKINHAFLINKNGKLFEWNIKKKFYGKEIYKLPEIKDLTQSNLDIRRLVQHLI